MNHGPTASHEPTADHAEQAEPAEQAERAERAEPTGRTRGGDEEHGPPMRTPSGRYGDTPDRHDEAPEPHDEAPRPRGDAARPRDTSATGTLTQLFGARGRAGGSGSHSAFAGRIGSGSGRGSDLSGGGDGRGCSTGSADSADSAGSVDSCGPYGFGDSGKSGNFGNFGDSGKFDESDESNDLAGSADEQALRRMLRGAVQDLEPADNALDQLHRAIPARRARRRQAVVGAAAAALLIGTAVPAFIHVANAESAATASPALVGNDQKSQGEKGEASGAAAGEKQSVDPARGTGGRYDGKPESSSTPSATDGSTDADSVGAGAVSEEELASIAALPACAPDQLGVASASAGTAGADGKVYGAFRIANTSSSNCSVSTSGTVGFTVAGAADATKIAVVQHVAGDAAAGLPDPAAEPAAVLLRPQMTYEVQFAWVPTDTCPTAPTPTPVPSDGPTGEGVEGTGQANTETQFLTEDGVQAEGSVAVTHTPEAGAPTAETTIAHACAGTIYRTGILAGS